MATVMPGRVPSTIVGGVLCLLAVVALRTPPEAVQGDPDPTRIDRVLEDIRDGRAEEKAEGVAEEPGLVPLASPCLMRRPRQALGVDQLWRHRFAAATLATTVETRLRILDELMQTAPDDMARWRVDLAFAELGLRAGDDAMTRRHLDEAALRNVPDTCRADEAFFLAMVTEASAQSAALLDRAVALDPGFWSAQEQLALLAAKGTGADPASCEADAVRTLQAVVQLGALARQDVQFQRLKRAVDAMPLNGRTALLRGMILRQTGEPQAARQVYAQGLAKLGKSRCDAILARALDGLIAATEDPA